MRLGAAGFAWSAAHRFAADVAAALRPGTSKTGTASASGARFLSRLLRAAARTLDCGHLLTEDLQNGQEVEEVAIVNPFEHSPSEVLHENTDGRIR